MSDGPLQFHSEKPEQQSTVQAEARVKSFDMILLRFLFTIVFSIRILFTLFPERIHFTYDRITFIPDRIYLVYDCISLNRSYFILTVENFFFGGKLK